MNEETWQVLSLLGPPCKGKTCSFYFSLLHHDANKQGTSTITWLIQTIFLTKRGGNYRGTTLLCGRKFLLWFSFVHQNFLYFGGTDFCDLLFLLLKKDSFSSRFHSRSWPVFGGRERLRKHQKSCRQKLYARKAGTTARKQLVFFLAIFCNFREVRFN